MEGYPKVGGVFAAIQRTHANLIAFLALPWRNGVIHSVVITAGAAVLRSGKGGVPDHISGSDPSAGCAAFCGHESEITSTSTIPTKAAVGS